MHTPQCIYNMAEGDVVDSLFTLLTSRGVVMKFRICLLSIVCCLLSAVQVDAGQNSNAVISLDYVVSGQGNQTDDGVMSGTVL